MSHRIYGFSKGTELTFECYSTTLSILDNVKHRLSEERYKPLYCHMVVVPANGSKFDYNYAVFVAATADEINSMLTAIVDEYIDPDWLSEVDVSYFILTLNEDKCSYTEHEISMRDFKIIERAESIVRRSIAEVVDIVIGGNCDDKE